MLSIGCTFYSVICEVCYEQYTDDPHYYDSDPTKHERRRYNDDDKKSYK
jgi:hypothetical protein